MIIFNDTVSIGDTLWTFPTVAELCKRKAPNEEIYIHWTNTAVGELFPKKYHWKSLSQLFPASQQSVYKVSMHDIVHAGAKNQHLNHGKNLCSALLAHWGFEEPTRHPINIEIDYPLDKSVPVYDFVISPYVLADAGRRWAPEKWQFVIDQMKKMYPGSTFCVIGSSKIPKAEDLRKIDPYNISHFTEKNNLDMNTGQYLQGVDYFFDQPLTRVAQLMANTRKLFLSVDSGPSNLMSCIRRPHLVLYHNRNNFEQTRYPGINFIYKDMNQIQPMEVLQKVLEIVPR